MRNPSWIAVAVLVATSVAKGAAAEPPTGPLTLDQAVDHALAHHPTVAVDVATAAARSAEVKVGRAGYLPNLDLNAQLEGGSGNVLRGALFYMPGIPNVSGPPTGRSMSDASLGSLFGVSAWWDALGLVTRMAEVDAALSAQTQAHAAIQSTRLLIGYAAADQFIDFVSRKEAVAAAKATVERARVFTTIVKALVAQDLRPGADGSRADAELALANTQLIRAEQAAAVSQADLARALGMAGQKVEVSATGLLEPSSAAPCPPARHPLLVEADAAVRAQEARKRAVDLSYLPRLSIVGALWIRGSGLTSGMLAPSPGAGIVPDTPNWSAGLLLSWPALELVAVRARSQAQAAQVGVAEAHRREVEQAVQSQIDGARAVLDAAHRIAQNTPVALQAARAAEAQATARYRAGLASVDLVAEAQRILAQAEIDDAVARLNVRRAELLLSRAVGDLSPFVNQHCGGR